MSRDKYYPNFRFRCGVEVGAFQSKKTNFVQCSKINLLYRIQNTYYLEFSH
jgi:hypothetical protein